jgi:hypothetical protein
MITLVNFLGGHTLFIGAHGHRRAMRIGTGDHQHIPAAQAVIASEDIGGQVGPGDVSNVDFSAGVGPGDGN